MAVQQDRPAALWRATADGRRPGEPDPASTSRSFDDGTDGRTARRARKILPLADRGAAEIMRPGFGSSFLGFANTFRSLTASPIASAVHEAHRMARRRFKTSGAAASASPISSAGSRADSRDFLLPLDIDADEVVKAIKAKLGDRDHASTRAPPLLARKAGGHMAVSGYHILRLGDGRFDLGRRFVH